MPHEEPAADPRVEVVLATYNSARFLNEQIESILQQSYPVSLIVRDDGSRDETQAIIHRFSSASPGRVRVIEDRDGNLGIVGNFSRLLTASTSDLVFLSDADDVWDRDKVGRIVERARRSDPSQPMLIHSDLRVVDDTQELIADSLWRFQALYEENEQLPHLLVRNTVTGCAAAVNRALLDVALPIPDEAMMHDWWLALVAAAMGEIRRVDAPLLNYRQHGSNAAGAQALDLPRVRQQLRLLFGEGGLANHVQQTFVQAHVFTERYASVLPERALAQTRDWAAMSCRGPMARRLAYIRGGYRTPGVVRTLGVLAAL